MANRITVVYTCNHAGRKLAPVEVKYWDTTPKDLERCCWCMRDGEKGGQLPTPMIPRVVVAETKPE
jgi:hypothetical protein